MPKTFMGSDVFLYGFGHIGFLFLRIKTLFFAEAHN
ncbi:hypothetical protein SAMN05216323_103836 [Williamwhitmania taraxaci]|uniref:Uncharacterized protein n=1 Tax=Williamwhitmania taraxaci TaxID=1640674 RepID=A0A1G6MV34_9BACT|nr:hypothetical protein SAMN05216323_103836 [Williamwhitmania taraxaci]